MNGIARLSLGCLLAVSVGCDDPPAPSVPKAAGPALGMAFDPATTGEIHGQVVWQGETPIVPPFFAPIRPGGEAAAGPRFDRPNPYAPVIEEKSRGVVGAIMFLRSVDPRRSRPWDWPPVQLEMRDFDYRLVQGNAETRTGFVLRGDEVEFMSRQPVFHSMRGRGDAFFTLAFADADRPVRRGFDKPGVVELSSAAGFFWARANLFVAEHPYYARTDSEGRFTLPQVPPGEYELVCWLPDWHEQERELDADTWQLSRLTFRPPVETTKKIAVEKGKTATAGFTLSPALFGR